MNRRWFAALKRGIGWKPATWQGWLILILYLSFIIYDFIRIYNEALGWGNIFMNFLPQALVVSVLFAFICYFTGEKPRI